MDYLSEEERSKLELLRRSDPQVEPALRQLDRILTSRTFEGVHGKAKDFLSFAVALKLLNQTDGIKEIIVGIRVWKTSDFNPLESSKVRTAAGSLRGLLAAYYRTEGKCDPIEIRLPPRRYIPQIRDRRIVMAVNLFQNMNPKGDQAYLCAAVRDEIAHHLVHAGPIEAKCVASVEPDISGGRYTLRGCLVCGQEDSVKVSVWLQDLVAGRTIWDAAFEGPRNNLLALCQSVADGAGAILQQETEPQTPRQSDNA